MLTNLFLIELTISTFVGLQDKEAKQDFLSADKECEKCNGNRMLLTNDDSRYD